MIVVLMVMAGLVRMWPFDDNESNENKEMVTITMMIILLRNYDNAEIDDNIYDYRNKNVNMSLLL